MTDLGRMPRRISASKAGVGRVTTERPRYEPTPGSDDDFMTRVQLALGLNPKQLANVLGVSIGDVVDRTGPRVVMSNFVDDPFWGKLLQYVNNTLAGCLAIKDELDRKARLDRRAYHKRLDRVLTRE